ncbi:WecA-like glycosyltransferase [Calycomorphotria hydatis]|uniref:WecA-like glycosyltransferase n=2 Tax=Calycomorphotria hydatis TaxID=2528027 RepID=A0A517TCJ6_9PLAN|nr:WecA-like glycosyltransferase [Calycomorphotria hydatis]
MFLFVLICFLPALLISAVMTEVVRRFAPRIGLIDQPAARKVHETPTPLGGGIAIYLGLTVPILGALLAANLLSAEVIPSGIVPEALLPHIDGAVYRTLDVLTLLFAGTALAAIGLWDDLHPLPWQPRLLLQGAAAALVSLAGPQLSAFIPSPIIGAAITVLWVMVLINSFNFLDNMNGLSGGIAMIASLVTALIMFTAFDHPHWFVGGVMLMLAGALLGFLIQNWQGRIFMGDSGSYFVGLMIATLTAAATFYEPDVGGRHVILAPLCILAVPLYDFCSVLIIRLKQGRSPFQPDKSHFSHRLVEMGMRRNSAVLTIYLATATTGLAAMLLYEVNDWKGTVLILLLTLCVLAIIAVLETVGARRMKEVASNPDQHGS